MDKSYKLLRVFLISFTTLCISSIISIQLYSCKYPHARNITMLIEFTKQLMTSISSTDEAPHPSRNKQKRNKQTKQQRNTQIQQISEKNEKY